MPESVMPLIAVGVVAVLFIPLDKLFTRLKTTKGY